MFRGKCFCIWWFIVIINVSIFDFYVSLCIVLLFIAFFPLLYLWYFCVHWFIWVQCDFDIWLFLWLINFTSVIDVAVFFFSHWCFCAFYFSKKYFFLWNLFTLNQDYLTVFYIIYVLVTITYLVWYVFGCFILFLKNTFLFECFLLLLWNHIVSYIFYIVTC